MAFNSRKVEQIVRSKGIKAKEFFAFVYPDRSGNASFPDIIKNDNPKADTIERIADLLECSIDELFDRNTNHATNHVTGDNNTIGSTITISTDPHVLNATISHLHDTIERQDKTIERQQNTIDDLNRRIDQLIELAKRCN